MHQICQMLGQRIMLLLGRESQNFDGQGMYMWPLWIKIFALTGCWNNSIDRAWKPVIWLGIEKYHLRWSNNDMFPKIMGNRRVLALDWLSGTKKYHVATSVHAFTGNVVTLNWQRVHMQPLVIKSRGGLCVKICALTWCWNITIGRALKLVIWLGIKTIVLRWSDHDTFPKIMGNRLVSPYSI